MRLLVGSLVGCLLFLSTLVCSSPAAWTSRDLWERDGGDSCVIDLRSHQVTKALGGSESAHYVAASSECEKLHELVDRSQQLWASGDRNQSVVAFYQVFSPQADIEEIERVQAFIDRTSVTKQTEDDEGLNAFVFGSITESSPGASHQLVKRWLPWVRSPNHRALVNTIRDLAHSFVMWKFGPILMGGGPRSYCLEGACMSWALDIPDWPSQLGNDYIQDLLSKYPSADRDKMSAHSWDYWSRRGTVCVSNRPNGCTNHG